MAVYLIQMTGERSYDVTDGLSSWYFEKVFLVWAVAFAEPKRRQS